MPNDGEPIPGFVYDIRIADDPQTYKAMCLREVDPADDMAAVWFVLDYGDQGTRLCAARYVEVIGVDEEHARALWAAFMPCGRFP